MWQGGARRGLSRQGGAWLGLARGPTARHTLSQKGKRCLERNLILLHRPARS